MKKMFILGMTVLILSMAFIGCGGGGDDGPKLSGKYVIIGHDANNAEWLQSKALFGINSASELFDKKFTDAQVEEIFETMFDDYSSAVIYKDNLTMDDLVGMSIGTEAEIKKLKGYLTGRGWALWATEDNDQIAQLKDAGANIGNDDAAVVIGILDQVAMED